MSDCGTCRFWSEMVAFSEGCGPIKALCLAHPDGPNAGKYTTERTHCEAWKDKRFGAVDDPPNYGEFARMAYEKEEGKGACEYRAALSKAVPQRGRR